MNAFERARAAMASHPDRSTAAIYTPPEPPNAEGIPVRVVRDRGTDDAPREAAMLPAAGLSFRPRSGGRLAFEAQSFRVANVDQPDAWTFNLILKA